MRERFQDLICSPSDVLEPRKQGSVRVSITVNELLMLSSATTAGRHLNNRSHNGHHH